MDSKGGGQTLVSVQVGLDDLPTILAAVADSNPGALTMMLQAAVQADSIRTERTQAVLARATSLKAEADDLVESVL